MLGIDKLTGEENLKGYVKDLVKLAKAGNSKAIETINNGIEDDIKKVELTGADGSSLILPQIVVNVINPNFEDSKE